MSDGGYLRGEVLYNDFDKKKSSRFEMGTVLGLGLRPLTNPSVENINDSSPNDMKDPGIRFFGPLSSKPSTYLSAFVIYIATIGDIVDGIDTTHDFNFFSLIYEWPKDVRLFFLQVFQLAVFIPFILLRTFYIVMIIFASVVHVWNIFSICGFFFQNFQKLSIPLT